MPQSRRSCSGTIDFARASAATDLVGVRHQFVEPERPADPPATITSSRVCLTDLSRRHARSLRPGASFIGCE
jgi:hypothetical protein